MEKKFEDWSNLKKKLDSHQKSPSFEEREIWWCSIGINVGHEENGKSDLFSRPVLVVRKFNRHMFLGVPLTSKIKEHHKFYHKINFKDKEQSVMISQIIVWESKRLTRMKGKLSAEQFGEVRNLLSEMILGKYPTPHF
ncbi:MAG: type II toxin-antitoxin system PemK/MazF family toxin [Proteobacteria bacterium]|nr:type II toxin-antitoxin system PemK/MazF family toxin [Pseudomonadota bacterium]